MVVSRMLWKFPGGMLRAWEGSCSQAAATRPMRFAADFQRHSGRPTALLHDAENRHIGKTTGSGSTYPAPSPVQTNPARSLYRFQLELAAVLPSLHPVPPVR